MLKSLRNQREMADLVFQEIAAYLAESLDLLDLVENGEDRWNQLFSTCGTFDEELLALANLQLLRRSELTGAAMAPFGDSRLTACVRSVSASNLEKGLRLSVHSVPSSCHRR